MRMDYRRIITEDVDWLFEHFELLKMELSKSVDDEWDFIVKLKMGAGICHPASEWDRLTAIEKKYVKAIVEEQRDFWEWLLEEAKDPPYIPDDVELNEWLEKKRQEYTRTLTVMNLYSHLNEREKE